MNDLITDIDLPTANQIIHHCEHIFYKKETILIYKKHVPLVAYLLVKGRIDLIKLPKKELVTTLEPKQVLGLKELFNHNPFKLQAIAHPKTEIACIDKSFLFSLLEQHSIA